MQLLWVDLEKFLPVHVTGKVLLTIFVTICIYARISEEGDHQSSFLPSVPIEYSNPDRNSPWILLIYNNVL